MSVDDSLFKITMGFNNGWDKGWENGYGTDGFGEMGKRVPIMTKCKHDLLIDNVPKFLCET